MDRSELKPCETYVYVREGTKVLDAMSELLVELGHAGFGVVATATLPRGAGDRARELSDRLKGLMLEGFKGAVAIALLGVGDEEEALDASCTARDVAAGVEIPVIYVLASADEIRLSRPALLAGLREVRL